MWVKEYVTRHTEEASMEQGHFKVSPVTGPQPTRVRHLPKNTFGPVGITPIWGALGPRQ